MQGGVARAEKLLGLKHNLLMLLITMEKPKSRMGFNTFCNIRRWHLKGALVPDSFKSLILVFLFPDKFYQFYK